MSRMVKWKKILFILIGIFVVIRILYIGARGEVDKEYYTTMAYDLSVVEEIACQNISETFIGDHDRLNSLELIFNNLADDKSGAIVLSISNGDALIYQTNISLSNVNNCEWEKIYVNAEMQEGTEYTINLHANEDCTQIPTVFVVGNAANEITGSYYEGAATNGTVAINFGYLRDAGIYDRLSVISLWIIFILIVFSFLFYFERMIDFIKGVYEYIVKSVRPEVFITVLEVLAGIIIVDSSGIEFQAPTKIIIYMISLAAVHKYREKQAHIQGLTDQPVKSVFLYFLYVYAAFALVGQRILIYPLDVKLTATGLFVFLITIFWCIPVVNSLLYYHDIAGKYSFSEDHKIGTPVFIVVSTFILLLPALYNLFANNPGISSPDTATCMITNAQHLHGMNDWQPAFYCMVLRVIQKISNTTYAVIIVQYFFWAYAMNELLLFLRKKGMKENVLLCIAVFSGFNAGNFLHLNTIWKDIPYTLSLLWAFIILAKLSIDYEEYKHKWYIYLEFVVSMVGIYLYRKNGMVTFIIIAVALVIVLRKNIKVWLSVTIAVALIVLIKGPIYDYFEVQDTGRFGMYMGLGQDILGVYYAGGEVSEETLKMITMMTGNNNAEYSYTPTWTRASYEVDISPSGFIANYIDTFLKNPITMMRAVIAREDALWDIYMGQDSKLGCVNRYGTVDEDTRFQWNDYYPARRYVSMYTAMSAATDYTANSQWISAIVWRSGLFTFLGLVTIISVIFKKGMKKHLLVFAPIAGHIMSLLLSTGWSEFRYYWPLNLMNMALIFMVMVMMNLETELKKGI